MSDYVKGNPYGSSDITTTLALKGPSPAGRSAT